MFDQSRGASPTHTNWTKPDYLHVDIFGTIGRPAYREKIVIVYLHFKQSDSILLIIFNYLAHYLTGCDLEISTLRPEVATLTNGHDLI